MFVAIATVTRQTSPPCLPQAVLIPPSVRSSGSGWGGESHGRIPLGWTVPAHTSCSGHDEHLHIRDGILVNHLSHIVHLMHAKLI